MVQDGLTLLQLLSPLVGFFLVVLLTMPFRKAARLLGIVDAPGGRKKHDKEIPPIGGLIIFSVFIPLGVALGVLNLAVYWPLLMALIILLTSGALDDQFHIPAGIKFSIHVVAACFISFFGSVQAAYLGDLFGFGVIWTGVLSYPFTITAIVLLINAMNLVDGMDGLAGGISVAIFSWFMIACLMAGLAAPALVLGLLISCILGFLVFNMRNPLRRKASLFLGDAGSMSLGLVIAWFAVLLARGPGYPLEPISVAWIIGFPIFDTCAQFFRRVRNGKHPFTPDRGHFHHHFIQAGVPVSKAAPIIIAIVAFMGAIGVVGAKLGIPLFILTVLWILALLGHMYMSYRPARYVRVIKTLVLKFSPSHVDSSSVKSGLH